MNFLIKKFKLVKLTVILGVTAGLLITDSQTICAEKPNHDKSPKKYSKFINYPRIYTFPNFYHYANPKHYLITRIFSPKFPRANYYVYYLHVKGTKYDLICELGDKNTVNELRPIICQGQFPTGDRFIQSVRVNDFPSYAAKDNSASENRDLSPQLLPKSYHRKLHSLPSGFKLNLEFNSKLTKAQKAKGFKSSQSTCIHTYNHIFTCKNVYGHGFLVDDYSVSYF